MRKLLAGTLLVVAFFMLSGFKLDNAIVPQEEILSGGPPKDGIPAILEPKFISAAKVAFLSPGDQVIGIELGGQARAYPIRILNLHEVVNDTVDGIPIVITF
ncbi:MAG: DUF3179 domain-containing protein [Deltaproteobacteria bacterium]|jgi:hypothetical protein|nr:MAG: DUF3179 domain-containing protein [Deltaproteobacteria bacterium]